MPYAARPLQSWSRRAKARNGSIGLLNGIGIIDADTADKTVWNSWVFQPATDATITITLSGATLVASATLIDAPTATITVLLDPATMTATALLPPSAIISIALGAVTFDGFATRGAWPLDQTVTLGGYLTGLTANTRRKFSFADEQTAPDLALTLANGTWLLFDDRAYLKAEA